MDINEIVREARNKNYIIPAINIFGHEEAIAVIRAAEELDKPVILMTNKDAIKLLPVEAWASMLLVLANEAKVPVGIHLDHNTDIDIIKRAVKSGYSSVMFDGSHLSLIENINLTKEVVDYAHRYGVYVEGEIGYVPYSDCDKDFSAELTIPDEAKKFAEKSGVDWIAVSVGNVHKLITKMAPLNFDILIKIESLVDIPIVIHGASGIKNDDILELKKHKIGKINFGTVLRLAFGKALHKTLNDNPGTFDRSSIMKQPIIAVEKAAYILMKNLYQ